MSKPAAKPPGRAAPLAAGLAGAAGFLLFHFAGNAAQGYVRTDSLFTWWFSQWLDPQAETEHGWVVLGLSGWLLWRNLRASPPGPPAPTSAERRAVPAAFALGLLLHLAGHTAQQGRISIVGLLAFTWGVLALGGGAHWGRAARFPVLFLLFAIPVQVLDSVGFWLRVWVVDTSAVVARLAGVAVLQAGTQLLAPDGRYTYDVAAACSGVRSLTALAALALLAGYLNVRGPVRRALVLLSALPLVLAGNVLRILAIIGAAHLGGPAWGDRVHDVMGYGIFAVVLGGVLGVVALLRRFWPEPSAAPAPAPAAARPWTGTSALALAAVVAGLAAAELAHLSRTALRPGRGAAGIRLAPGGGQPAELPAFLGTAWAGRPAEVTAAERSLLPPDTGYSRKNYTPLAGAGPGVHVSIVLSGRDRTSIHRPELCLVGQGWTITGEAPTRFAAPDGTGLPATLLTVRREQPAPRGPVAATALVAYAFLAPDVRVATHLGRFRHDAWNRLVHGRADRWAYLLLQTDARDGEAAARARLQAVLDGVLPAILPPSAAPPR